MTDNRLKWKADKDHPGYVKGDMQLGQDMAEAAHTQTVIRGENLKELSHKSKTYWMTWDELSSFYRRNCSRVLPHACEFGHEHCSDKPKGACIYSAAMFDYMRETESAWIAAFHDERIQELIGPEAVNGFYNRMVQYDKDLAADMNRMLFGKGCYEDLALRYSRKAHMYYGEYESLKGACPMVRAENPPEPPCKVF